MSRSSILNILLAFALVISALSLVTAQYRARKAFVGVEIARGVAEDLAARHQLLRSDLTSAAQPAVINQKARQMLDMESLPADRTLYLTLRAGEGAARLAELDAHRVRVRDGGPR